MDFDLKNGLRRILSVGYLNWAMNNGDFRSTVKKTCLVNMDVMSKISRYILQQYPAATVRTSPLNLANHRIDMV